MLPPESRQATFLPLRLSLPESASASVVAPGRLDYHLGAFDEVDDGGRYLAVRHRHDVVHVFVYQFERDVTGILDGYAVRDGVDVIQRDVFLLAERHRDGGRAFRLDADDRRLGVDRLDGARHAGQQSAAARGNDDDVEVGYVLQHFYADRALARDDVLVVEGVDEHRARRALDLSRAAIAVVVIVAVELDGRAVAFRRDYLRDGRGLGHADGRLYAHGVRGVRAALSVVARAGRHDGFQLALGMQLGDLVVRAAHLERTGLLQVFALQIELTARQFGKRGGKIQRSSVDDGCETFLSFEYLFESHMFCPLTYLLSFFLYGMSTDFAIFFARERAPRRFLRYRSASVRAATARTA